MIYSYRPLWKCEIESSPDLPGKLVHGAVSDSAKSSQVGKSLARSINFNCDCNLPQLTLPPPL